MTPSEDGNADRDLVRLQRLVTTWCGVLGLACLLAEVIGRLLVAVESPALTTLAGVAIGALANHGVVLRRPPQSR